MTARLVLLLSLFFCLVYSDNFPYDFSTGPHSDQWSSQNGFVYTTTIATLYSNTESNGWLLSVKPMSKNDWNLTCNKAFPIRGINASISVQAMNNFTQCGYCDLIGTFDSNSIVLYHWNYTTGSSNTGEVNIGMASGKDIRFSFTCDYQFCLPYANYEFAVFDVAIFDGAESSSGTSSSNKSSIYGGIGGVVAAIIVALVIVACVSRRCKRWIKKQARKRNDEEMNSTVMKKESGLENSSNMGSVRMHTSASTEDVIGDRIDDVKIIETLGAVYKGMWQSDTAVAMKKITGGQIDEFKKEAKILCALHHPNVIRYLGLHFSQNGDTFMVMEFAQKGSLKDFLKAEKKSLQMSDRFELMISTARGMQYLESKQIIHRDLAARNVLVSVVDGKFQCKISDFGLSRVASEYKLHGQAIPFRWAPPELLRDETATPKSDVWSFAIVIHEILENGDIPYIFLEKNIDVRDYVLCGKRLAKSSNCPDTLYKLMLQCWQENGEDRPSFKELLNMLKLISPTEEEWKGSSVEMNREGAQDYQMTNANALNPYARTDYESVKENKSEEDNSNQLYN